MKSARRILEERRQKQLEYYHAHKDDPERKERKKQRDKERYEARKKEETT